MIPVLTTLTGQIDGGWEFVWASYAVTWLFLAGYTLSLWLRWGHPPPSEEE